jgi:3'-5' exoribonuclease
MAKETRAKKPYLTLELTDGTDSITGNYWDWLGKDIPAVNDILNVNCVVSEWNGTKQLTIKGLTRNTEKTLMDFSPETDISIATVYKDAYTLASTICNDTLRTLTLAILEELRMAWATVPGAKKVHHNYAGGTLVHSYSVAKIAAAIAENVDGADYDLVVAGALLHDVGKLFTYELNGLSIDLTTDGNLYDHTFIGAEFVGNFAESHVNTDDASTYRVVRLLRHIILSHHGRKEYGAVVEPACIEAYIVHFADYIDATSEQIRKATVDNEMWTKQIYTLGGRACLSPAYVKGTLEEDDLPF